MRIFIVGLLAILLWANPEIPQESELVEDLSRLDIPQEQTNHIVYLKNTTPESIINAPIYIGQKIPITYRAIFFQNASMNRSSFKEKIPSNELVLENPNQEWQEVAFDRSDFAEGDTQKIYEITYMFKVKASNLRIPAFEVSALSSDGFYTDSAISEAINLNATDLYQNKNYAGVVADELRLGVYKAKHYDDSNNLIAFELSALNANLEDFRLPSIEKQGIERSNFTTPNASAIFYAIVPRSIQGISFEYFSLRTNRFEQVRIPILLTIENVGAQENLRPKNTYLMYWTLFICGVMVTFFALSFFIRRWRKVFWLLGGITLCYLMYYLFYNQTAVLAENKHIWILPTHNSTLLETTSEPIMVKIIGEHDRYYKIMTPDDIIGWIRKEDVQ